MPAVIAVGAALLAYGLYVAFSKRPYSMPVWAYVVVLVGVAFALGSSK